MHYIQAIGDREKGTPRRESPMVYDELALESIETTVNDDYTTSIASAEPDSRLEASRTDALDARLLLVIKALDR